MFKQRLIVKQYNVICIIHNYCDASNVYIVSLRNKKWSKNFEKSILKNQFSAVHEIPNFENLSRTISDDAEDDLWIIIKNKHEHKNRLSFLNQI